MTEDTNSAAADPSVQQPQQSEDSFGYEWIANLLSVLDGNLASEAKATILRECATVHYHAANMEELISQYRGDLEGFIRFLSEQWQWQVVYDPAQAVITADENKSYCVCPLVQQSSQVVSGTLCHCSEGFAERMFSEIVGGPVKATVVQSVLRGDKSCVYSIQIL